MSAGILFRFEQLPFAQQLVVLSVVLDSIGLAAGFLLGPAFGLDPIMGAVVGVMLTSIPVMLWAATRTP